MLRLNEMKTALIELIFSRGGVEGRWTIKICITSVGNEYDEESMEKGVKGYCSIRMVKESLS